MCTMYYQTNHNPRLPQRITNKIIDSRPTQVSSSVGKSASSVGVAPRLRDPTAIGVACTWIDAQVVAADIDDDGSGEDVHESSAHSSLRI